MRFFPLLYAGKFATGKCDNEQNNFPLVFRNLINFPTLLFSFRIKSFSVAELGSGCGSFEIYCNLNNADPKTSIVFHSKVFLRLYPHFDEDEAINCEIEAIKKVSLAVLFSPPINKTTTDEKILNLPFPEAHQTQSRSRVNVD